MIKSVAAVLGVVMIAERGSSVRKFRTVPGQHAPDGLRRAATGDGRFPVLPRLWDCDGADAGEPSAERCRVGNTVRLHGPRDRLDRADHIPHRRALNTR
jgi:hypothetical protein